MQLSSAKDLDVYKIAYQLAMEIFEVTKTFPDEERFALTGQIKALLSLRLFKPKGSMGQATLRGSFLEQAD
jgi:hypothetical protein